jgi:DNA-binding MarR family transcriptional regulator
MPEPPDAVSLGRLANEVCRNMSYFISHKLAPYDLGKDDFSVLSILSARDTIEQGQLIEIMKSEKYTVTKIVGRLQKRGLVEKRHDVKDRRRLHLALTEEGQELLPVLNELKREITAVLSQRIDLEQAEEILTHMAENMREHVSAMKKGE